MATPPPDDAPSRELSSWERQLLSGLLIVATDAAIPRDYLPYDGPIPRTRRFPVIRYYGSFVQLDLLTPTLLPLHKKRD